MGFSTVIPETAARFSEIVVQELETCGQVDRASATNLDELTKFILGFAEKFESDELALREKLANGVETETFLRHSEALLILLDQVVSFQERALAAKDRIGGVPELIADFFAALERFGEAVRKIRDLTKLVVSKIKTVRPPINMQKIAEGQAAFARGETKPFLRRSAKNGN